MIAHATVILGILSGSTILYNIQYMTMQPRYECLSTEDQKYHACKKEDICSVEKLVQWRVDWTKEESLNNWVE